MTDTPWQHIRSVLAWLDACNEDSPHETAMRLMKVGEEAGEAFQAYIGMTGQNPRKGVTHTAADVAAELCDVILSAMTALHSFTDDPEATFTAIVRTRNERLTALLWRECEGLQDAVRITRK
ncbi:MazG-like family protein [Streptomyces sp. NBC_01262]|uniref:MazG-like family protein n=1 Tax=Streptomyces sp. NBC_01262 TaxID=2903803 RepID=UPI002E2EC804|nr:MazG-like family protein [Streptomyces sp. NBC_01262]